VTVDLAQRLQQCRRCFVEMFDSERQIYYSYVDIVGERVTKPCLKSSKRPRYEMVRGLSDAVRDSLDVPEGSFEQSCLDLAFSTNPLFGFSPENDEWFAEQSRVLSIYEGILFTRPRPASLAWCVGLCVALVTWYDLLFVKGRYLSGKYRKLISVSPHDGEQQQRDSCRTLQMLRSAQWNVDKIIETLEVLFPRVKSPDEESLTVQTGLRAHLFCHCLACGIADVLRPANRERLLQCNHDLVLGLLIEWYGAVCLFAPPFRNLLCAEPDAGEAPHPADTNSVPPAGLLCQAADTFLRKTQEMLRGVERRDRQAVVDSLSALIWAAGVFETPGGIYPLRDSTKRA